jgi:hypothetical protein
MAFGVIDTQIVFIRTYSKSSICSPFTEMILDSSTDVNTIAEMLDEISPCHGHRDSA